MYGSPVCQFPHSFGRKKTVNQWNSVSSWPASPSLGSPAVQPVELPFRAPQTELTELGSGDGPKETSGSGGSGDGFTMSCGSSETKEKQR